MTLEQWLTNAQADAERRERPALKPLLAALAASIATIRQADWRDDASGESLSGADAAALADEAAARAGLPPADGSWRSGDAPPAAPSAPGAGDEGRPASLRSIGSLAPLVASGAISAEALLQDCLERIEARNRDLRAVITLTEHDALTQAYAMDEETAAGRSRGPLHGIPFTLKDLIDQRGVPTTAASRIRRHHIASADAAIVSRLREAGAVLVGKTNLHEFAFGTTSDDTAYGAVRNPHDLSRSPGGSSGGSAVAVVTGMSVASVGTDTGGSIRIPAAACGLVGLKPTYGEIPLSGVTPLSWSLDHAGPIARSVTDAWWIYLVLRGDPTSALWPLPARPSVRGVRFGVPTSYFLDVVDQDVRGLFDAALTGLRDAGAWVPSVDIPHASDISAVYSCLSLPEAAAYHAETVAERWADYTEQVGLRCELGRYLLAEDYARAQRGRLVLRHEVDQALASCDALLLPTLPIPPQPVGATAVDVDGRPHSVRALMLRLTQLFNLTGHPAISLPGGSTPEGLPWGLQLVGRRHQTESLLGVAAAVERLGIGRRP